MKPEVLFHGTPTRSFILEPHDQTTVDGERGKFVFAQPDEKMAHVFALKVNPLAPIAGGQDIGWYHLIVASDKKGDDWKSSLATSPRGSGGFIHEVSSKTFRPVDGGREWVSEQQVVPRFEKTRFVTIEDAMRVGIQIFVADKQDVLDSKAEWMHDPIAMVDEGVKAGKVRWFNLERDINPIDPPSFAVRNDPIVAPLQRKHQL